MQALAVNHTAAAFQLWGEIFLFFSKTNFYPLKITRWRFTFFQSGCRHSGFPQSIMFPLIGWSLGHFWATLGNFSFYQPKNSEKVIFSFSPQSKFISSTHFLVPRLKLESIEAESKLENKTNVNLIEGTHFVSWDKTQCSKLDPKAN